jgi:hypothetical protein
VSRRSQAAGGAGGNGSSYKPSISGDGGVVSFATTATNLGGAQLAGLDVYAYDRAKRRVELLSHD